MNKYLRKKYLIIAAVVILLIILLISRGKDEAIEYSSTTVERIDLIQSVEETGSVEAALEISYGFEMNGKIIEIKKITGDEVQKDDVVARIENSTQLNSLRQAQASLASASAALNLRITGASDEEKLESSAKVEKAEATLAQARAEREQTLIDTSTETQTAERALETAENDLQLTTTIGTSQLVADAYADLFNTLKSVLPTLSDALRESDNILGIENTTANDNFEELLSNLNHGSLNSAKTSFNAAKNAKLAAESTINDIRDVDEYDNIDLATTATKSALTKMRNHLIDTKLVLDNTTSGSGLTETQLNTKIENIITAQTNVNTKTTSATNDEQAVSSAKNSLSAKQITYEKAIQDLDSAKRKADTKKLIAEANVRIQQAALDQAKAADAKLNASPRDVDLGSLRADVQKQQAAVASAKKDYDRTFLKAIADGVLAKVDVEIGENITANQAIISIISGQNNIEVDISESDISKVNTDDITDITLDAFGDDVHFAGKVISIEPAETEISGVIYYKTRVVFDENIVQDIKPGMTANVSVITDKKPSVLTIPSRAVLNKDGKQIVRVVTNSEKGTFDEVVVETGLRGDAGKIEITNGLNEGAEVITFIKENGN